MIGMTHSGAGFGGSTRYLLQGKKDNPNPDRVLWTSTRELTLEEPQQAAFIMRATAALGRTDKPAGWHKPSNTSRSLSLRMSTSPGSNGSKSSTPP